MSYVPSICSCVMVCIVYTVMHWSGWPSSSQGQEGGSLWVSYMWTALGQVHYTAQCTHTGAFRMGVCTGTP